MPSEKILTPGGSELSLSARWAARLLDAVPDPAFVRDREGRFIYVNEAGAAFVGGTEADVLGRTVDDLFPPKVAARLRQEDRVVLGGETVVHTSPFPTPSGEERLLQVVKAPVRDPAGQVVGVAGIARDVAGGVGGPEAVQELESRIVQAQKLESLRVMAGGIAHDFNNLLAAILGNAELALKSVRRDGAARDCIVDIREAAKRAAELSQQMLAFAGQGPVAARELDLNEELLRSQPLLESIVARRAAITFDLCEPLPRIKADAVQLRQVLVNLVTNAVESIESGEGLIEIATDVEGWDRARLAQTYVDDSLPEGSYVLLRVRDNGCGMDEATRKRVFEPFFSRKFTGRGLGLAAVLGIVRGHSGAVEVTETRPSQGTTVTVAFPALAQGADVQGAPRRRRRQITTPPGRARGRVLVVDDEAAVRSVGRRLLQEAGFEVETAADGLEALDVLERTGGAVDVILLDLTMPRLGGDETYQRIRERYPDLPVVLVSGYGEPEVRRRFHGRGLAGFIQKPYNPGNLIRTLRMVVDGSAPPFRDPE